VLAASPEHAGHRARDELSSPVLPARRAAAPAGPRHGGLVASTRQFPVKAFSAASLAARWATAQYLPDVTPAILALIGGGIAHVTA
jgi:hypothetical protein